MWYSKDYDPIQVGSIDGTDIDPHDAAVIRATRSNYRPPKYLKTDPKCTLFISRLNFDSTETTIKSYFEKYGPISNIELVRNNVTGLSQGYAFVTFVDEKSTQEAYKYAHETTLDSHIILVDYERSRVMKGWIPRRFGGGFGGKKESGQLRFGARDRPFRDNKGKIHVDYDQRRSDAWKYPDSKRSNHHSRSSRSSSRGRDYKRKRSSSRDRNYKRKRSPSKDKDYRRKRSASRDRNHRGKRSSSRDKDHRRKGSSSRDKEYRRKRSPNRDHRHEDHRSSQYYDKRRDDRKDYSRSLHQKSRSESTTTTRRHHD